MKRIAMVIILLAVFICTGCASTTTNEVHLVKNAVFVDKYITEDVTDVGFNFSYIYTGLLPNFTISEVKGTNLDNLEITCEPVVDDGTNEISYKGYKLSGQCVNIDCGDVKTGDNIIIDSIVFSVNNQKLEYVFDEPISIKSVVSEEEAIYPLGMRALTSSKGEYHGSWEANQDVVLTDVSLGKLVDMKNVELYIAESSDKEDLKNKRKVGNLDSLPINIKKGEVLLVRCDVSPKICENYTYIFVSSILEYTADGKECKEYQNLKIAGECSDSNNQIEERLHEIVDNELYK